MATIGSVEIPLILDVNPTGVTPSSHVKGVGATHPAVVSHKHDAPTVDITIGLVESLHSTNKTVLDQRSDVFDLLEDDPSDVDIDIDGWSGWLAVQSVNIPSSSSLMLEGTITATFLDNDHYNEADIQ